MNTSIQLDGRFTRLNDDEQLAYFKVFFHPNMTLMGMMRATAEGLAAEFHWELPRLIAAMRRLAKVDLIEWDQRSQVIAIPDYFDHNPLVNGPQVNNAWPMALAATPDCALTRRVVVRAASALRAASSKFQEQVGGRVWKLLSERGDNSTGCEAPAPGPAHVPAPDKDRETDDKGQITKDRGSAACPPAEEIAALVSARDAGVHFNKKSLDLITELEGGEPLHPNQRQWYDSLLKRSRARAGGGRAEEKSRFKPTAVIDGTRRPGR